MSAPPFPVNLDNFAQAMAFDADRRAIPWSDIQPQMAILRAAAAARPACVAVELGVRTGNSTAALLAGIAAGSGHLWSVDSGPVTVPEWWRLGGHWTFIPGDDLAPTVLGQLPAAIDLLFIDTDHMYAHTLAELRAYLPRMAPRGVVYLHDTELDTEEMAGYVGHPVAGPRLPVAAALDDFCAEAGLSWTNTPGNYGLGRIDVP